MDFKFQFLSVGFVFLISGSSLASEKALDWIGGQSSAASRFRSHTGVTHPILYGLPEWSRSQAVDLDIISKNSAALSAIHKSRSRWLPLSLQGLLSGNVYDVMDVFSLPVPTAGEIIEEIRSDQKSLQRMQVEAHSYYVMRNFAYSLHYNQQRNIWIEGNPEIFRYQFYRDIVAQFSTGSQLIDSIYWGRFDFGFSGRGIFRYGNNRINLISELNPSFLYSDSMFKRRGALIAIDLSLLWSSPGYSHEFWGIQIGLTGKNVGTTRFLSKKVLVDVLDNTPDSNQVFPKLPNDTTLGVALKLPNFSDGFRSAFRLEWNQWARKIPVSKKLALSYELRMPRLVSVYSGLRGSAVSGGLGIRFNGFEIDFGTFVDYWGQGLGLIERRGWMMELRSEF